MSDGTWTTHEADEDGAPLPRVDELAAQLADGPLTDDLLDCESLDSADQRRLADFQFLDTLLKHIYQPHGDDRERRVRQVMAAIEQESPSLPTPAGAPVSPSRRRRLWAIPLVAAAALLLMAGLFWRIEDGPSPAIAAVEKAMGEAQAETDRQYSMTITARTTALGEQTTAATLYVNGSDQFAVRHAAPLGEFWLGGDGQQVWFVPEIGPVLVGTEQILSRVLNRQQLSTPFLQITSILQRLKNRYELRLLGEEPLSPPEGEGDSVLYQKIRGTLKTADPQWPRTIDVWVSRQSGIVQRVVLNWDRPAERQGLSRLELRLVGQSQLPDDWYTHAGHHGPRRIVIQNEERH